MATAATGGSGLSRHCLVERTELVSLNRFLVGFGLPELLGFVRTITDRTAWKLIRRSQREQALSETKDVELARSWQGQPPLAPNSIELDIESPLPETDQHYLIALLRAGSKAKLARQTGVSRAAVTQRVKRILKRVDGLDPGKRMAHEAWLEREVRSAVSRFD